ncbi:hypothetical protein CHN56_03172 [Bacillus velezensis]|nr:hypothetical protein [Bacillus velezensis]ASS63630.1 hypothetical protein CHN56_03172 [Bacillus velezensis]QRL10373.1 hypothetical protein GKO36_16145 [Bacillus velezensis]UBM14281.1 hypothetical protein LAZ96_16790 [Bacillus velezensis]
MRRLPRAIAFLFGIIAAFVAGVFALYSAVAPLILLVGVIIFGYLNVTSD